MQNDLKPKKMINVDDEAESPALVLNPIGRSQSGVSSSVGSEVSRPVSLVGLMKLTISDAIAEYLEPQKPAVLEGHLPLSQFSEMIRNRGLRSCIVRTVKPSCFCGSSNSYAFLDVRDTTYLLMQTIRQWRASSFSEIVDICCKSQCKDVANISKRSPFSPIDASCTVQELCSRFAVSARVAVFSKNELLRIMSPIDFVIMIEKSRVGPEIQRIVRAHILMGALKPVSTLMDSDYLSKAINLLEKNRISALPIVELKASGLQLKDVISVTDVNRLFELSQLFPEKDYLNTSCMSYVDEIRTQLSHQRKPLAFLPENEASMRHILHKFSETKASRIFVVDPKGAPVSMVTQTDVIRLLAEHLGSCDIEAALREANNKHRAAHANNNANNSARTATVDANGVLKWQSTTMITEDMNGTGFFEAAANKAAQLSSASNLNAFDEDGQQGQCEGLQFMKVSGVIYPDQLNKGGETPPRQIGD